MTDVGCRSDAPRHAPHAPRWRRNAVLLTLLGVLALTAGCGGSSDGSTSGDADAASTTAKADVSPLLPKKIQDAGVVEVAADATYPPMVFTQGGKIVGVDPDLAKAIGEKLGVTFHFNDLAFAGIIPAIKAGRYDVVMSYINRTPEREASVDYVDAYHGGTSILVRKGNPEHITKIEDLCGHAVGTLTGSSQIQLVDTTNAEKCKPAGEPPIDLKQLPKDTDVQLFLKSDRIVANLTDTPVAFYTAQTADGGKDFEVVPDVEYGVSPHGFLTQEGNTDMLAALNEGLKEIMADGTYDQILKKWNVERLAIKAPAIHTGDGK